MLKYNGKRVEVNHFPDGTLLMKEHATGSPRAELVWCFEDNEEMVALYYLVRHLQSNGISDISLKMPYIPNARQDRVKQPDDIFTLKYFSMLLNELKFKQVTVLDPHSYVSEALIDRICVETPEKYVEKVLGQIGREVVFFYPDEGAMKRYSAMFDMPYVFGMKKRDWATGEILGLSVSGKTDLIKDSTILIVDDICSRGGTFYHSAKALKELGAGDIYLYVSHCENTVLEGDLINSGLVKRIYTTDSIFTKEDERVEVFTYE